MVMAATLCLQDWSATRIGTAAVHTGPSAITKQQGLRAGFGLPKAGVSAVLYRTHSRNILKTRAHVAATG